MNSPAPVRTACLLAAVGAMTVATVGLVACGSDVTTAGADGVTTATARAASPPNADGVCPERRAGTQMMSVRVVNLLPNRVTFHVPVDAVNCSDWSGKLTPYTAFNQKSVTSGEERPFLMELARPGERGVWTMHMRSVGDKGVVEGTRRIWGVNDAIGVIEVPMPPDGCRFNAFANAPKGWTDTPARVLDTRSTYKLTVIVKEGKVGYFFCVTPTEASSK